MTGSDEPRLRGQPSPIRAGTTIGRYIVVERIGAGGLGVVFSAYDPKLDRKIAIKLLRIEARTQEDEIAQQRLLREAQAMAKLDHPNVVSVHDVGTHAGAVFVAMELVRGQTLRAWLDALGPDRRWTQVVPPLLAAARGLAAAHATGLVHRDFKPDNVMVGDDGRVRVMDFGLVRALRPVHEGAPEVDSEASLEPEGRSDEEVAADARARIRAHLAGLGKLRAPVEDTAAAESLASQTTAPEEAQAAFDGALTQAGTLLGTPAYMAPEQIAGGQVDARCDQFALCVTLHEAVYGFRPFEAATWTELATKILEGQISPAPRGGAPRWLHAVILRGLSRAPADRFADLPALCAALERGRGRRRRWLLGATGAAVIASGVAYWTSRTEPCASAEADFEDTWNDTRRAAVQGGLAQTEGALAADTAPRAVAALDAYADRWIDARVEACRATHVEYAQSGELLDRSIGCLRRDERVFAALVDELVSGGDDAVEHAVDAVARLPSIARCRDLDTLLAEVEPPSDPDAARRVEALRGELARAEALEALGRYAEGAERVEPLRAEAEATGHGPVVASAALVHGRLLDGAGRPEVAAAALRHAAKIGRASGADETAAEAEVWLAFVIGYRLRRVDEGRWWAEHAEAAVQRSGTDGPLDGRLPAFRGVVEFAAGEVDTALPLLERGAKLLEERLGPDHPDTLEATYNLAVAHRRRGDLERARALHEVTRARREAKLGPTHPAVGTSLQAIGVVEAAAGDPTAAAALLERALRLLEDALGPQHPKVAGVLNDLGAVRFSQKRDEEAMACWARAERILVAALGPEHPDVQRSRRNRERAKAARSAPGLSAR